MEKQVFFTADLHLGHANVLRFCNRPFKNIEEHDASVVSNINNKVQPEDILYILGDFVYGRHKNRMDTIRRYRNMVRCRHIVLIVGNHDPQERSGYPKQELYSMFSEVFVRLQRQFLVGGLPQIMIMDHYASRVWNKSHYGAWQLFGHSHASLPEDGMQLDVGIDSAFKRIGSYSPFSLQEVNEIMKTKKFSPVDHHTGKSHA
jgi:calcineurin-like phosphoesterase family protein